MERAFTLEDEREREGARRRIVLGRSEGMDLGRESEPNDAAQNAPCLKTTHGVGGK
jgi:hypothetical protein